MLHKLINNLDNSIKVFNGGTFYFPNGLLLIIFQDYDPFPISRDFSQPIIDKLCL